MSRQGGVPKRKVSTIAVKPRLIVFTEGTTEEQYIKQWERVHRRSVAVDVDPNHGLSPYTLVERASVVAKREQAALQRGRQPEYVGGVWCVFDCDVHPKLPAAFEMARANGVRIAFSNPCLELWFLLHFEEQTACLHHKVVQSRSEDILGCRKNLSPSALDRLVAAHSIAMKRAQGLATRHLGNGDAPNSNPSSTVWELIEMIRNPPKLPV